MTSDRAVGAALRGLVSSETRLALVLATLVIGAGAAFGLAFFLPAEARTYAMVAPLAQLITSIATPLSTALLTNDLLTNDVLTNDPRQPDGAIRSRTIEALRSRWIAAGSYGLAMGGYVAVVVGIAVAAATGSTPATDPWAGAGPTVLGSLVVQLIPVGVGCGAGLLIARARRAQLATVLVPLAASFVLARLAPAGTTDWVTPLAAADHLLPGPMSILNWAQWIVTAAVWVVLPNAIGARLLMRRIRAAGR